MTDGFDAKFDAKKERLIKTPPSAENERLIRELAGEVFCRAKSEGDPDTMRACLLKLRSLENMKRFCEKKCEYGEIDVSQLIESVCLCADILLSELGVSVKTQLEPVQSVCCPAAVAGAFLNLLSNAAKFGSGGEVSATVRKGGGFVYVGIENEGSLLFDRCQPRLGVRSAANSAHLHKGNLLYSSNGSRVRAVFSLSDRLHATRRFDAPVFSQLLSDEFSQVHVGLSDCRI